jgi:hypothetical protein
MKFAEKLSQADLEKPLFDDFRYRYLEKYKDTI